MYNIIFSILSIVITERREIEEAELPKVEPFPEVLRNRPMKVTERKVVEKSQEQNHQDQVDTVSRQQQEVQQAQQNGNGFHHNGVAQEQQQQQQQGGSAGGEGFYPKPMADYGEILGQIFIKICCNI